MGKWIIEPGKVHSHEFPDIGYDEMRAADGAIWECACGARFKYVVTLETWDRQTAIAGEWFADESTFTVDELMGWK